MDFRSEIQISQQQQFTLSSMSSFKKCYTQVYFGVMLTIAPKNLANTANTTLLAQNHKCQTAKPNLMLNLEIHYEIL